MENSRIGIIAATELHIGTKILGSQGQIDYITN